MNQKSKRDRFEMKEKKYRVVRIDEPDFGCEGRPDGEPALAKVYLESEDGEKIERMEPDAMLYQKEINEGTCVRILADGRMEKQ